MSAERLPKSERLRKRREFLEVQGHGAKVSAGSLLALVRRNEIGVTRLGLTVSNKVGNSVVRNRIRRRLRELFRKRKGALPAGLDLVLVARASAKDADFARLARDFEQLTSRLSGQSWGSR